jgi:hypothetical protein
VTVPSKKLDIQRLTNLAIEANTLAFSSGLKVYLNIALGINPFGGETVATDNIISGESLKSSSVANLVESTKSDDWTRKITNLKASFEGYYSSDDGGDDEITPSLGLDGGQESNNDSMNVATLDSVTKKRRRDSTLLGCYPVIVPSNLAPEPNLWPPALTIPRRRPEE